MSLTFYPHPDDANKGSIDDRLLVLMEAAERYKAFILDVSVAGAATAVDPSEASLKRLAPRDLKIAFNWEEIAKVLREIREMSEADKRDKLRKGQLLGKLSEVYEVLRAAKMSKLEAVRLALMAESNQLKNGAV